MTGTSYVSYISASNGRRRVPSTCMHNRWRICRAVLHVTSPLIGTREYEAAHLLVAGRIKDGEVARAVLIHHIASTRRQDAADDSSKDMCPGRLAGQVLPGTNSVVLPSAQETRVGG